MGRVGIDAAVLPRVDTIDRDFIEALLACNGSVRCAAYMWRFFDGSSVVDVNVDGGVASVRFSRDVINTNQYARLALSLSGWRLRGVDVEAFDAGWAAAAIDAARLIAALVLVPDLIDAAAGMLARASRLKGSLVLDASTRIHTMTADIDVDAQVSASKAYVVNMTIRVERGACTGSVESRVDGATLSVRRVSSTLLEVRLIVERPLDYEEAKNLLEDLIVNVSCA